MHLNLIAMVRARELGHQVCSSSKFISDMGHLNLLYFSVLNLFFFLGIQPPFTVS